MDLRHAILESTKENIVHRLLAHPFLDRCRNGTITLAELKEYLVQQGFYSAYFTRYLCALMANLPSNDQVLELAENLFEELGFDKNSVDHATPHYIIYRNMLTHFGISLKDHQPTPETKALIATMLDHCKNANPAYGLGAICLGAEALVAPFYAEVIKGFLANGVDIKEIDFLRIHVECDDGHAETIRDIMVDVAAHDAEQIQIMINAGHHLVKARFDFLSAIEAKCGTRKEESSSCASNSAANVCTKTAAAA